jgi:hypothetical protein
MQKNGFEVEWPFFEVEANFGRRLTNSCWLNGGASHAV